jgi:hypothetical protein
MFIRLPLSHRSADIRWFPIHQIDSISLDGSTNVWRIKVETNRGSFLSKPYDSMDEAYEAIEDMIGD